MRWPRWAPPPRRSICNKIFRLTSEAGVLLRRRSRRPPGRLARAGERAAAGARRTRTQVHVPARGTRSRHPGRRGRRGGFREAHQGRAAAIRIPGPAAAGRKWTSITSTAAPSSRRWPRPLFARMPEGVYREMLAERLAARVGMPAAASSRSLLAAGRPRRAGTSPAADRARAPEPTHADARSDECRAGQSADARPSPGAASPGGGRRSTTPRRSTRIDKPGVAVLKELLEQAGWACPAQHRHAARALAGSAGIRPPGRAGHGGTLVADAKRRRQRTANGGGKAAQEYGPGRRMDELLRKAEEMGLNYDEKAELSLLLKSKGRPRRVPLKIRKH